MRYLLLFLALPLCAQWTGKALVGNNYPQASTTPRSSNIGASGDIVAQCGILAIADTTTTKTLSKVGFKFGAVTKAGGSTVRVSLQDVDLTAGPPVRPDGTPDQSVTIANADAGMVTGAAYLATLGSTRSVTAGDFFCAVFDYASYGGADSINFDGWVQNINLSASSQISRFASAAWTDRAANPNIYFEFSDGTYGNFSGTFPFSALGSTAYNSGSGADEIAAEFTVSQAVTIDAVVASALVAGASSDFEIVLYSGTTALNTCTIDANTIVASAFPIVCTINPRLTLAPGTTYHISVKPTTANNVTLYYVDLPSAGMRSTTPYSTQWSSTSRVDAGSWAAPTTTRLYNFGYRIVATSASTGGGSFVVAQ